MTKKKGADRKSSKKYTEFLRKFFKWFGSHFVIIMFAIIVIGFSLASMAHVFTFAKFYNLPFFAGMFMVAMELGLIGTTIIFSMRDMLAVEEIDKRAWWRRFLKPKKDPVLSARRFGTLAVFVIFISLYIINVFSAFYYYSTFHAAAFAETATFMSTLFFITISPEWLMKILAHIAAGILPFGAYTFGKMVALHIAQKRQEKDIVGVSNRKIKEEPKEKESEEEFWGRFWKVKNEMDKVKGELKSKDDWEGGDEVKKEEGIIEEEVKGEVVEEEPGVAEETADEEPFRSDS